jgi:hypothetical protein
MKKLFLSFLLLFLSVSFVILKSQTIRIDTTQISYEDKLRPCIGVQIDPGKDELTREWANYLKKNYKVKLNGIGWFSTKEILTALDVMLPTVSDRRMNFYTRITSVANGSEIKIFASYGYDIFIGDTNFPKEYSALQHILNNFLLKFVNDYYSDQISEIAKKIQHYNSLKIGIMKTNVNLDKKIFKITNDISVLNATIEEKSAEAIKNQENLSKMNNDKIKFENQKSSSLIQIQIIENNIKTLNLKIDDFKTKQANLL